MGSILDSQHFEEDILLISKVNNLNFLHCESSHWGNTALNFRQKKYFDFFSKQTRFFVLLCMFITQ